MKLHCPHCGVKGSTDDSYSGRKVKCPECKELFVISPDMVIEAPEEIVEPVELSHEPADGVVGESINQQEELQETDSVEVEMLESEESDEAEVEEAAPEEIELEETELDDVEAKESEPEDSGLEDDGPGEEEEENGSVELEAEIEQEPYGIEKKQCWQCGVEESSDDSFITSNGRLYCTDCAQPESPDAEDVFEETPVESAGEQGMSEIPETAPEKEPEKEEPAKGGAWAKIKSFFNKQSNETDRNGKSLVCNSLFFQQNCY